MMSIGFLVAIPGAWACSMTEEGVKRFLQLCPTKRMLSDCTCDIYGIINVNVLSIDEGQPFYGNIAIGESFISLMTIAGIILIVSAFYIKRKRPSSQPKD